MMPLARRSLNDAKLQPIPVMPVTKKSEKGNWFTGRYFRWPFMDYTFIGNSMLCSHLCWLTLSTLSLSVYFSFSTQHKL